MVVSKGLKSKLHPLGNIVRDKEITYFAWVSNSDVVYTQAETPNELYGEHIFSGPNVLSYPITAHTDTTITANNITYTRDQERDRSDFINVFYYTIDNQGESTNTIIACIEPKTYTNLIDCTITVDWGDENVTEVTDGVISEEIITHTYTDQGTYLIKIKCDSNKYFVELAKSTSSNTITTVNSVMPKSTITKCTVFEDSKISTVPQDLFKYNTEVTSFSRCFYECRSLISIPQDLFKYNTKANDFSECFYDCYSLETIPQDLFKYNTEVTDFGSCFNVCKSLTSIPQDLFKYNTEVTGFGHCFNNCTSLTSIPQDLFKYNTKVTGFSSCFRGCKITSIPQDLFKYNTEVIYFSSCFSDCHSLTSVPEYLFRYNLKAFDFSGCFYYCEKLQLNSNIFCDENTEINTRFIDVQPPEFDNCFNINNSRYLGLQGTAPQLWNYTYSDTPTQVGRCFYWHSTTSLTNYNDIPAEWK